MLYTVFDAASGKDLGSVNIDDESDSAILEMLVDNGYLDDADDDAELDLNYNTRDTTIVVVDEDGTPVLTLEACDDDDGW